MVEEKGGGRPEKFLTKKTCIEKARGGLSESESAREEGEEGSDVEEAEGREIL